MKEDSPRSSGVRRNLLKDGAQRAAGRGGSMLFTEPVLVVSQKPKFIIELDASSPIAMAITGLLVSSEKVKLIELNLKNQYAVFDQNGKQVASVLRVSQSTMKKVMQVLTGWGDQIMTHSFHVVDMAGTPVLALTMPPAWGKSKISVADGLGNELGEIVQQSLVGKIHFGLHAQGRRIGSLKAENWRAWTFSVADQSGTEVARITKASKGVAKTIFTTAPDDYVVQVHRQVDEPLRGLVLASALCVDILKQNARGTV